MRGRRADHEDRLACKRELPHRVVDLFRNLRWPRVLVQPCELVERQPHLAIIGIERLYRAGSREHDQRGVGTERARLRDILPELLAQHRHIIWVEKQVAELILAMSSHAEHARERPCLAAHLRFKLGEHHALPAANRKV